MATPDKVPIQEQKSSVRFLILILCCMAIFADYFIIDIPAVIQMQITNFFAPKYGKETAEYMYSLLYTIYSLPNIILPLFGGVLTDKYGYRKMTIIFMVFITLGQIIIASGMEIHSLELMIAGRFIFGIGGESINITINLLIVNWFKGSEMSFAQSLNLSIIRCASVLNAFLTPRIATIKSMESCFNFGVLVCLFSLLCSILLVYLDYMLIEPNQPSVNSNQPLSFWKSMGDIIHKIGKACSKFSKLFWYLTILMASLYTSVLTFNTFSSSILADLWLPKENTMQHNQEITGQMMSVPYIMACFLFPVVGLVCDKYGQRVRLLIMSSFLILISFILLPLVYPWTSLTILGISYAIFGAVIWPTVSYVVPAKRLGIGYGVMNSIQNMAAGVMPLIIAFIKVQGSSMAIVFTFIIISLISIYLVFVFARIDSQQTVSLNDSEQCKLLLILEPNSGYQREQSQDTFSHPFSSTNHPSDEEEREHFMQDKEQNPESDIHEHEEEKEEILQKNTEALYI